MKVLIALLALTCSYVFLSNDCEVAIQDDHYIDILTYIQETTDAHPRCQQLAAKVILGRYSEIDNFDEVKYGQCYRNVVRIVRLETTY